MRGNEAVGAVHGPMARSVADLRLWAENVVGAKPWRKDPKCIELPWRPVQIKEKPKIAVLWDNGIVTPTPPVRRALKIVVDKLKARGYDIVDWSPQDHAEAMELLGRFFVADGGKSIRKILEEVGEPFRPEMHDYEVAKELGVYELWQLQAVRTSLCKRYLDRWAACEGLDAILGPTTPYAAPKNGQFKNVSYTGVFNILDYSSVSFPAGVNADKAIDVYPKDFKPHSDIDKVTQEDYDPAAVHDIPVSLQLTGQRLQEEKLLALTEKLVAHLA